MGKSVPHHGQHSLAGLTIVSVKVSLIFFDTVFNIGTLNILLNVDLVLHPDLSLCRLIDSGVGHRLHGECPLIGPQILLLLDHGQVVPSDVLPSFWLQLFL